MWFIYLLRSKSEVSGLLEAFRSMAENHFQCEVGAVHRLAAMRSDGAGENDSDEVRAWCSKHGIVHELSAPSTQ